MGIRWERTIVSFFLLVLLVIVMFIWLTIEIEFPNTWIALFAVIVFGILIELTPEVIGKWVAYDTDLAEAIAQYCQENNIPISQTKEFQLTAYIGKSQLAGWVENLEQFLDIHKTIDGPNALWVTGPPLSGKTTIAQIVFSSRFMEWNSMRRSLLYPIRRKRVPVYIWARHLSRRLTSRYDASLQKVINSLKKMSTDRRLGVDLYLDSTEPLDMDFVLKRLKLECVTNIRFILISRRGVRTQNPSFPTIVVGEIDNDFGTRCFHAYINSRANTISDEIAGAIAESFSSTLNSFEVCTLPLAWGAAHEIVQAHMENLTELVTNNCLVRTQIQSIVGRAVLTAWSELVWSQLAEFEAVERVRLESYQYPDGSNWLESDPRPMRVFPAARDLLSGLVVAPPLDSSYAEKVYRLERNLVLCGESGTGKTSLGMYVAFQLWKRGIPILALRRDEVPLGDPFFNIYHKLLETPGLILAMLIDDVNLVHDAGNLLRYKKQAAFILTIRNEVIHALKHLLGLEESIPTRDNGDWSERRGFLTTWSAVEDNLRKQLSTRGWDYFEIPKEQFHSEIGAKLVRQTLDDDIPSERPLDATEIHIEPQVSEAELWIEHVLSKTEHNLAFLGLLLEFSHATGIRKTPLETGIREAVHYHVQRIADKCPLSLGSSSSKFRKIGTLLTRIAPFAELEIPLLRHSIVEDPNVVAVFPKTEIESVLEWLVREGEVVVHNREGWDFYGFSHAQLGRAIIDQIECEPSNYRIIFPELQETANEARQKSFNRYVEWLLNRIITAETAGHYRELLVGVLTEALVRLSSIRPDVLFLLFEHVPLLERFLLLDLGELANIIMEIRKSQLPVHYLEAGFPESFESSLRGLVGQGLNGAEWDFSQEPDAKMIVDAVTLAGSWWVLQSCGISQSGLLESIRTLLLANPSRRIDFLTELPLRDHTLSQVFVSQEPELMVDILKESDTREIVEFFATAKRREQIPLDFKSLFPALKKATEEASSSEVIAMFRGLNRIDWLTAKSLVEECSASFILKLTEATPNEVSRLIECITLIDVEVAGRVIAQVKPRIDEMIRTANHSDLGTLLYAMSMIGSQTMRDILRTNASYLKEKIETVEPQFAHGVIVGLHLVDEELGRELVRASCHSLDSRFRVAEPDERAWFLRCVAIADDFTGRTMLSRNIEFLRNNIGSLNCQEISRFLFEINSIDPAIAKSLLVEWRSILNNAISEAKPYERAISIWFVSLVDSETGRDLFRLTKDQFRTDLGTSDLRNIERFLSYLSLVDLKQFRSLLVSERDVFKTRLQEVRPNTLSRFLELIATVDEPLAHQILMDNIDRFRLNLMTLDPNSALDMTRGLFHLRKETIVGILESNEDAIMDHFKRANSDTLDAFLLALLSLDIDRALSYVHEQKSTLEERIESTEPNSMFSLLIAICLIDKELGSDMIQKGNQWIAQRMKQVNPTVLRNVLKRCEKTNEDVTRHFVQQFSNVIGAALKDAGWWGLFGLLEVLCLDCETYASVLENEREAIAASLSKYSQNSLQKLVSYVSHRCPLVSKELAQLSDLHARENHGPSSKTDMR